MYIASSFCNFDTQQNLYADYQLSDTVMFLFEYCLKMTRSLSDDITIPVDYKTYSLPECRVMVFHRVFSELETGGLPFFSVAPRDELGSEQCAFPYSRI